MVLVGAGALMALVGGAAAAVVVVVVLASVAVWLIGLGAVVLLWRQESSDYFNAVSATTG